WAAVLAVAFDCAANARWTPPSGAGRLCSYRPFFAQSIATALNSSMISTRQLLRYVSRSPTYANSLRSGPESARRAVGHRCGPKFGSAILTYRLDFVVTP